MTVIFGVALVAIGLGLILFRKVQAGMIQDGFLKERPAPVNLELISAVAGVAAIIVGVVVLVMES